MGVGQEQQDQRSLSSFHSTLLMLGTFLPPEVPFSIQLCVLLGYYKDFILDLAVPFPIE